ncbi:MAG: prepilin-type N-terminal cleavage/methylation domain-containing protein [Elusimicrobia bacterium]|nr:prepilin-type N-terminal cleavage/methylation domain-containing protein [Elusimicrobiota bacterium]
MKIKKKKVGFTLIEMIIAIAVIIILSAVSIPIYKGYSYKSKMVEGYTLLASIRDAQLNYYTQYGCFLKKQQQSCPGWSSWEKVLGIDARSNKYYTWFYIDYGGDGIASKSQFTVWVYQPSGGCMMMYYNLTSGATYESKLKI